MDLRGELRRFRALAVAVVVAALGVGFFLGVIVTRWIG